MGLNRHEITLLEICATCILISITRKRSDVLSHDLGTVIMIYNSYFVISLSLHEALYMYNTLLKSNVTRRDHVVHCHGSQECWFTLCQFRCPFHSRRHSLRITLKSTTLVHMRSRYAWTRKSWQRSEWRLDFNSVLFTILKDICCLSRH